MVSFQALSKEEMKLGTRLYGEIINLTYLPHLQW